MNAPNGDLGGLDNYYTPGVPVVPIPDQAEGLVRITPHCDHWIGNAEGESGHDAAITMVRGRITFKCAKCKQTVVIDSPDILYSLIEWVDQVLTTLLGEIIAGRAVTAKWTPEDVLGYVARLQAVAEKLVLARDQFVTDVSLD